MEKRLRKTDAPLAQHIAVSLWLTGNRLIVYLLLRLSLRNLIKKKSHGKLKAYRYVLRPSRHVIGFADSKHTLKNALA
jgi:hypothetical protein